MLKIWHSSAVKYFLVLIVLFLLLLDLYDLSIFPKGLVNYDAMNAIGVWFSGFFTFGAVLVAIRSFDYGKVAELKKTKDAERDKVDKLFSWLQYENDLIRNKPNYVMLVLVNNTPLPIYEWAVEIEGIDRMMIGNNIHGPIFPGNQVVPIEKEVSRLLLDYESLPRTKIMFVASNGEKFVRTFSGDIELFDKEVDCVVSR